MKGTEEEKSNQEYKIGNTIWSARLLAEGDSVNAHDSYGRTALHRAACNGHEEIVQQLLAQGISIDTRGKNGHTALHYATCFGKVEVVKYLLEQGASIDALNNDGSTILHYASQFRQLEIVKHLLEQGASIDMPDNNKPTALHYAAHSGHLEIVKYWLKQGANINALDKEGNTALHIACWSGHLEIVRYLLEQGASIDMPDKEGTTALHIAAKFERVEVVKHLLEHGAQAIQIYSNGPEKDWCEVAELLTKIFSLNTNNTTDSTILEKVNKNELIAFVKNFMTNYLIKNGFPVNYQNSLAYHFSLLSDDLKEVIWSNFQELIAKSNEALEFVEGLAIHDTEGLSPCPYSKVVEDANKVQEGQELMEFYQQNPDYKKLGTYISKISNSDSTIGVSVLNYLMLRDTIFADQVMYLTNKCILLASLKQRLEKAVIKHKEYIRDKNLLTNVQQQEQIEELKTTLLEQPRTRIKINQFFGKNPRIQ